MLNLLFNCHWKGHEYLMNSKDRNQLNLKAYELVARLYAGDEPVEDDPVMRSHCRELFTSALTGKDVVEVGCGPGVDSSFLHAEGLNVTATDFSSEFIQIVRERYPEIHAHQMDMMNPDLPANSYDGVYAFASFIHIPRSESSRTLKGFYNLLRKNGVIFLSLIRSSKVSEYLIDDWGGISGNSVLFTCYQPEDMNRLLTEAGFIEIKFHEIRSKLYEEMPRLIERGVVHYQVTAIK